MKKKLIEMAKALLKALEEDRLDDAQYLPSEQVAEAVRYVLSTFGIAGYEAA